MRYRLLLPAAVLVLATALPSAAVLPELGSWTREGIVFSDVSVHNLDVVSLGSGQFRAYFMNAGQIKSAFSADEGDTFAVEDGFRVDGQHPALVDLGGGNLRMYYVSNDPADEGAILSATSTDGLTWTPEDGVRLRHGRPRALDSDGLIHLNVVSLPGGGYRMYYDAVGPGDVNWRGIVSATSADGLTWTKDDGVRIKAGRDPIEFAGMVWSPFAETYAGGYKLYFCVETDPDIAKRRAGIYVATSSDGLKFTVRGRVLGMDPDVTRYRQVEGGMRGMPQDPFVIPVTGGKRLFYWQARDGTFSAFLAT